MAWFSCLCISVGVFHSKLVVTNIAASHFLYVTFLTGNNAGSSGEAGAHGVHAEVYVLHVLLETYLFG